MLFWVVLGLQLLLHAQSARGQARGDDDDDDDDIDLVLCKNIALRNVVSLDGCLCEKGTYKGKTFGECLPCEIGRFQTQDGAKYCEKSPCPPNSFAEGIGNVFIQTVCSRCANGKYTTGWGNEGEESCMSHAPTASPTTSPTSGETLAPGATWNPTPAPTLAPTDTPKPTKFPSRFPTPRVYPTKKPTALSPTHPCRDGTHICDREYGICYSSAPHDRNHTHGYHCDCLYNYEKANLYENKYEKMGDQACVPRVTPKPLLGTPKSNWWWSNWSWEKLLGALLLGLLLALLCCLPCCLWWWCCRGYDDDDDDNNTIVNVKVDVDHDEKSSLSSDFVEKTTITEVTDDMYTVNDQQAADSNLVSFRDLNSELSALPAMPKTQHATPVPTVLHRNSSSRTSTSRGMSSSPVLRTVNSIVGYNHSPRR